VNREKVPRIAPSPLPLPLPRAARVASRDTPHEPNPLGGRAARRRERERERAPLCGGFKQTRNTHPPCLAIVTMASKLPAGFFDPKPSKASAAGSPSRGQNAVPVKASSAASFRRAAAAVGKTPVPASEGKPAVFSNPTSHQNLKAVVSDRRGNDAGAGPPSESRRASLMTSALTAKRGGLSSRSWI